MKLPEYQKPHVGAPIITSLGEISQNALSELISYFGQMSPTISIDNITGLKQRVTGATSTQTPGAVAVVNIPHGLGSTPLGASAEPGNAAAAGAPAFHITLTATNIVLNFAANLAAATQYMWVWTAIL